MFFGPFPFQPPSDEDIQKMKEAEDRRQLEIQSFQHDFQTLFTELDEGQLRTMRTLLHLAGSQDNPSAWSWEAMVAWELRARFGVCVTCGKNHDKDFFEAESEEEPVLNIAPESFDDALPLDINMNPEISDGDRKVMELYHLDDLYEEETGRFLGFACTGIEGARGPCGVTYPSIADRIIKGPEDCSGCFQRIMHG